MNFKQILLGSAVAVFTFGLVACGGDSGSNADPTPTPSSASQGEPYKPPQNTEFDVIGVNGIGSNVVGEAVFLTGSFSLKLDTNASKNADQIVFNKISFQVVNDTKGTISGVPVVYNTAAIAFPFQGVINVASLQANVSLTDPAFGSECGSFHVDISVNATDGEKNFPMTASATFTRPESYCQALIPSSSSAAPVGIIMTTCDVELATNGSNGLDLASCTAAANPVADIVVAKDGNGDVNITSGNGSTFSPITNGDDGNYSDDWSKDYYPEDNKGGLPTYNTDFKFREIAGTSISKIIENEANVYVVKTPFYNEATASGFFAFVLLEATETNNKDFNLTFRVWRAAQ